ncbi:Flp pilus assembly complex ATPase component TadA [bacterium]|nr:Flp pilus assembly complex ATPase component TadA [bacterium]
MESPSVNPDPEWEQCLELARSRGLSAVRLSAEMVDQELLKAMPHEVLLNYRVLPLSRQGFELTLAMADPLDVVGEDIVRQITGCRVLPVVAMSREILEALAGRLGQNENSIDSLLQRIPDVEGITYLETEPEEVQNEEEDQETKGPVIQLVNSIIGDAIRMGASDIHVEPQKTTLRVRYRLDGSLRTIVELPKRVQSACLSRLKLMAGIDISETRKPQDGRARALIEGREVDLRVSSLPTFRGERVVLRILDSKAVVVEVERLGFSPLDFEKLTRVLAASQGMILCTGPTGSGKTSTLYSALVRLNEESDNIITVEDPVEYQLSGVSQVQVNVRAGLTFAAALRSILRQDPDVVLIGEIRDLETAEIAVQAAQTGHLVLSTLHTNDALSTLGRLVLMGVAPYLLASSLLCVIAQRLVRRLCPHCCKPASVSEGAVRLLALAGLSPDCEYREPVGCDQCRYVGYKGRLGLFEMVLVTDRLREMLLAGNSEAELEVVARQEGMRSLLEDGLAKCSQGHTSLEEVLRVITVRQVGGRVCGSCSASVPGDLSVCVYCGQDMDRVCPGCRRPVQATWLFCPGCKRVLAAEVPTRPVAPLSLPAVAKRVYEVEPETLRAGVLLLSGDQQLLDSLELRLDKDYKLFKATRPDHARDMIGRHVPDVLVLDGDTPGLDAGALVGELRSRLQTAMTQVILLMEAGPDGLRGLDCGADEFLLKPVDEVRLSARVAQVLQRVPRAGLAER